MRPKIRELTHDHQSGKWDIDEADYEAMLNAELRDGFDVLTLTEVSPAKFRALLIRWCERHDLHLWHPVKPGANECAVISRLPFDRTKARELTPLRLKVGRTAPTYLISVRIKGWGWFSVLHTPAHTGGLHTWGSYRWPTRVYRSILDHFAAAIMGKRVVITGDWNLELRHPANVALLEHALGHGVKWTGTAEQKPTEGGRVIDGDFSNQKHRKAVTGVGQHGFDHKRSRTVYIQDAAA